MALVGFKRKWMEILKAGRKPKTGLGLKAESLLRLNCPRASAEPLNLLPEFIKLLSVPRASRNSSQRAKIPFPNLTWQLQNHPGGPRVCRTHPRLQFLQGTAEGSSQLGASGGFLFLSLVLCQLINQLINNSLTLTSKNTIKVLQPLQKFIPKENFLCHHLSSKHSRQSQPNHPKKSARQNSFSFKLI